jgi:predicted nuclease of predicted toxin-antitoxin system
MRFLANENIGRSVVARLRQAGHDVLSARESMRGKPDHEVLARAAAEERVLLTFDKDFGEFAFRSRLPAKCRVVLFRITQRGREQDAERLLQALKSRDDWSGAFWTVSDQRMRRRSLPPMKPQATDQGGLFGSWTLFRRPLMAETHPPLERAIK